MAKYYEIVFADSRQKERFIECIVHEMSLRNWCIHDLAVAIGKSDKTLYEFLGKKDKENRFVAAQIANLFQLQRKEWIR